MAQDSPPDFRQLCLDLERLFGIRTKSTKRDTQKLSEKETLQLAEKAMDVLYNDIKITILERLSNPVRGLWNPGESDVEDVVARHWDYIRSLLNRTLPVSKAPERKKSPALEANSQLALNPETRLSTPFKYVEEILKHITNPEPEPERSPEARRLKELGRDKETHGKTINVPLLLDAPNREQNDIKTIVTTPSKPIIT